MNGYRYRFSIDIVDKGPCISATDIKDVADAAVSAARLAIPAEKAKDLRVAKVTGHGGWHPHHGDRECSTCMELAEDGKGGDLSEEFPEPTIKITF